MRRLVGTFVVSDCLCAILSCLTLIAGGKKWPRMKFIVVGVAFICDRSLRFVDQFLEANTMFFNLITVSIIVSAGFCIRMLMLDICTYKWLVPYCYRNYKTTKRLRRDGWSFSLSPGAIEIVEDNNGSSSCSNSCRF